MSRPRFYVMEFGGIPIFTLHANWTVTYSVMDRAYCHREVARFGNSRESAWTFTRQGRAHARKLADSRCATLNAQHEEAMRA